MEAGSHLKRRDTTKGPPLRILSLDGGGVRGYSMLIILQELMHRTFVETEGRAPRRHEIPRPCDHFDLIVGTGTGGLIAIMLGRLRLDIDTCKEVYVRMTRKVFETDKTFAGIPYRGTLFKASKLEEAIKECVAQHTIDGDEGNDAIATARPMSSDTPGALRSPTGLTRSSSNASRYSQVGMSPISPRQGRWGNPNTQLYDMRQNRTKTAVTAVFKGAHEDDAAALLRSYDSRKEPAIEGGCSIWEAGRATCATGLAFKPAKVGQSVFIDEGSGKYNPAPQVLDEAVLNEWPGRAVGVFVSVGTGKRPTNTGNQQHLWWESFVGGAIGDFAEARRRLISKIEGCEETHQYMLGQHLFKRRVDVDNYFRLNVEIGVGEFGMNEWNRLSDISSSTRMYLARPEVTAINNRAAGKLAHIHFAITRRQGRYSVGSIREGVEELDLAGPASYVPRLSNPMAFELPAEDVVPGVDTVTGPRLLARTGSLADAKYSVIPDTTSPRPVDTPHRVSLTDPARRSDSSVGSQSPDESTARQDWIQYPRPLSYAPKGTYQHPPPPIPPKTPLPYPQPEETKRPETHTDELRHQQTQRYDRSHLPYPDTDGPPPPINMARKPQYGVP